MRYLMTILTIMTMTACGQQEVIAPVAPTPVMPLDYVDVSSKTEVACPAQTPTTAVFFAYGQSNSANSGEHQYQNTDARIINFFEGRCYIAADPMLGSSGGGGSVWIPIAERVLASGAYYQIIIMNAGVSGSAVEQWVPGGYLNSRYMQRLGSTGGYRVTHYLWHQGESNGTTSAAQYQSWLQTVIDAALIASPHARYYVSVTSRCANLAWTPDVAAAQRAIVNGVNILQGPDTDAGIPLDERQADRCHMSTPAQEIFADLWLGALQASPGGI